MAGTAELCVRNVSSWSVRRRLGCGGWVLAIASCWTGLLQAQLLETVPKDLQEVGIVEQLGAQVPLDLPFVESNGRPVKLQEVMAGERPVVLTLNYSNCPMLCSLQLNGLFDALRLMPWKLGENFQLVTLSIDPTESPQRAQLTKQKYLKLYGRAASADGWRMLTGKAEAIRKLTDAVGFHFKYLPESGEYAHAAAAIILTPDGRVSRYLYGIQYDPQTIRLSLVEAGEGKIGSTMDHVLLYCFHYDATAGRYAPAAQVVMRLAALAMIFGVGCMVFIFWRRGNARRAAASGAERGATAEPPATGPKG